MKNSIVVIYRKCEEVVITKHICQGQNFGQIYFFPSFPEFVKISKRLGCCKYSEQLKPPYVLLKFKNILKCKAELFDVLFLEPILNFD